MYLTRSKASRGLPPQEPGLRGMRVFVRVLRTLVILLLILRVLAAPLAMRPVSYRTPSHYHLVARICAWPVQRSPFAASLVLASRGRGPNHTEDRGYGGR